MDQSDAMSPGPFGQWAQTKYDLVFDMESGKIAHLIQGAYIKIGRM